MVNIYQVFGKVLDHLPVLPGNRQDLSHENIVNTYLLYQVFKVSVDYVFLPKDHLWCHETLWLNKTLPNIC